MPTRSEDTRVYYEVINPHSTNFGMKCEYVRTTREGNVVLLAGRPWHKIPLAFEPSEVRKVEVPTGPTPSHSKPERRVRE